MRRTLAALAASGLIPVLAACGGEPTEAPPIEAPIAAETLPTPAPTDAPSPAPAEEAGPDIPYASTVGGFCLMLPGSWEGHYRAEEMAVEDAEDMYSGMRSVTRFLYTPTDASLGPQALLSIMTMAKADFEAIDPAQEPPPGTLIAEEGEQAWLYAGPQSNPYEPGTEDATSFDVLYEDLGDITERFAIGSCPASAASAADGGAGLSAAPGGLPEELLGRVWSWESTGMSNDDTFTPAASSLYSVTFSADGSVAVRADCNAAAGSYSAKAEQLSIAIGPVTTALCAEGSLSETYLQQLGQVGSWMLSEDGALVLLLAFDSGSMIHRSESD